MKIALGWQISSYFGWGVYGLNLALEWSKHPEIEASAKIGKLDDIVVDRLRRRALMPFAKRSVGPRDPGAIAINALGNELGGGAYDDAKIGAIFFEAPLSREAIERGKRYEVIVAGSTWNAQVLKGHGLDNVVTIFQGVDRSLFHPAPKRGLYPDKFVIFSGGKAEPRKGQDLVVKAFRAFAGRHKDVMLVTAWHSPWPGLAAAMDLDLSRYADRVIDVGPVPNGQMATVYRECDVALFPNRCEGGTNLVAMECIACGVPTIVSKNSGHRDLVDIPGVLPLTRQGIDRATFDCESDVEEIVEALEMLRRQWEGERAAQVIASPRAGLPLDKFTWREAAASLAALARQHQPKELAYG